MRITIAGDPQPKARHRSYVRGGQVFMYDPQSKENEVLKNYLLSNAIANEWTPTDHPLCVSFIFELDAFCGASKAESIIRLWNIQTPAKKPDIDNLIKQICDLGNGILWSDDRFIIELSAIKRYSNNPCTIIDINPITEIKMTKEHENVFKTFSPEDMSNFFYDISNIYASDWDHLQGDFKLSNFEMASTANTIIKFADTWADKLKKIKTKDQK